MQGRQGRQGTQGRQGRRGGMEAHSSMPAWQANEQVSRQARKQALCPCPMYGWCLARTSTRSGSKQASQAHIPRDVCQHAHGRTVGQRTCRSAVQQLYGINDCLRGAQTPRHDLSRDKIGMGSQTSMWRIRGRPTLPPGVCTRVSCIHALHLCGHTQHVTWGSPDSWRLQLDHRRNLRLQEFQVQAHNCPRSLAPPGSKPCS